MSAIENVTVAATDDEKTAKENGVKLLSEFGIKNNEINKRPKAIRGSKTKNCNSKSYDKQPKSTFC